MNNSTVVKWYLSSSCIVGSIIEPASSNVLTYDGPRNDKPQYENLDNRIMMAPPKKKKSKVRKEVVSAVQDAVEELVTNKLMGPKTREDTAKERMIKLHKNKKRIRKQVIRYRKSS